MKNKHHIIPRYMGGSNSPDNLVEVTLTQHAMFHYCNWRLWGNKEDEIAWKALSGQISIEDVILESRRLGGRNSHIKHPDMKNKNLKRTGNPHKLWKGTPVEMRKEIAKKIQKSKGTSIKCVNNLTGEVHTFPSLRSARSHYQIGMSTIRKLYSGEINSYNGISVIKF
jgi:hypothetical protein